MANRLYECKIKVSNNGWNTLLIVIHVYGKHLRPYNMTCQTLQYYLKYTIFQIAKLFISLVHVYLIYIAVYFICIVYFVFIYIVYFFSLYCVSFFLCLLGQWLGHQSHSTRSFNPSQGRFESCSYGSECVKKVVSLLAEGRRSLLMYLVSLFHQ
jgi:hypothetical protein